MISKLFEEIDIIGSKFHFYQGKSPKRKTIFGGFLTIFLMITFITLIIIFGSNFFTRKNPSVTMSIDNDLKYEIIDLKKEKVFFAFRIEDYNGKFVNVSEILYFKIFYYSAEEDENGVYHSKIKSEFLSYHICNDSDYNDRDLSKNFGILYCPDLGGKKFGGYWDSPNLYYFEIQVYFCENGSHYSSNNTKCTSLEKLRNFFNQDDPKFFAFYYPLIEFNPLSYTNPIRKRYKNYYYILNYRLQKNDDVFLKKTIMNDDKGWLFNNYVNFSDWGVDSFKTTYSYYCDDDLIIEGVSTKIYELNLYTCMEKNYYSRYYMKLQNVIAIVGSLINLIFYICELLSEFIGDNILKLEIIQNTFDFSDRICYSKPIFKRSKTFIVNDGRTELNRFNSLNLVHSKIINLKMKTLKQKKKRKSIFSTISITNNLLNTKINVTNNKVVSYTDIENSKNNMVNNNNSKNEELLNQTLIYKNCNNSNNELSKNELLHKIKTQPIENFKSSAYKINNSKMSSERIKMYIFFFCYDQKLYNKIFKNKNSNIIHWYYMHLVQTDRYLELIKQFDFIKRILLNEAQVNSLEFLKKIDLKNEHERENLLFIKKNNIENIVINYFRDLLKSGDVSRSDAFIYDNLNEKIKKCVM